MTTSTPGKTFLQRHLRLLIVALCLAAATAAADTGRRGNGQRTLSVPPDRDVVAVARWMDIFEDPQGTLGLDEAQRRFSEGASHRVGSDTLNFGLTTSAYWLRFQIERPPRSSGQTLRPRVFDPGFAFPGRVRWSLYASGTGHRVASGGSRTDGDHYAQLEIPTEPRAYYLRVQTDTGLILRPRLYSWGAYLKQNRLTFIGFGVFYGVIFSVAVYNLFLFFSFNDRSYLWYVMHLSCLALYFLGINGLTSAYLLPRNPELVGMLNRSFLGLTAAFAALLTRSFLRGRMIKPEIDPIILIFFVVVCVLTVLNLALPARWVNTSLIVMGLTVPCMMTLAAWDALRSGYTPARLVMAAWAFMFAGVLSFALTVSGLLPYTLGGFYGFQGGAAVTAILLSIALGNRIRVLRAQRASFKQSTERVTTILNAMESGIFLIDAATRRIREINDMAGELIGEARERIIGRPCGDFIRSAKKGICPLGDLCVDVDRREDLLVTGAGKTIPVLKRAKRIELDGRDLILDSFVDITDLKEAEEALRKSESKFRSLFESSRDAVILLEADGFSDCNPAALEMFGCTRPEEMLGRHPIDFSPPRQPSGRDSNEEIDRCVKTALNQGCLFFEWTHRRLNGEEFPAEVMLSKVDTGEKRLLQGMVRDITQRKAMEDELKRLASTDPLTGADNRRSFLEKGEHELLRSRRYGHPFSLLMMDVDHFKEINDTCGHHAGDESLKALVNRSRQLLRGTDLFGRLGGEEFAVILTETDADRAQDIGQRLRRELAAARIAPARYPLQLTVSIGLAAAEKPDETLMQILQRADAALYRAKSTGRNQLVRG